MVYLAGTSLEILRTSVDAIHMVVHSLDHCFAIESYFDGLFSWDFLENTQIFLEKNKHSINPGQSLRQCHTHDGSFAAQSFYSSLDHCFAIESYLDGLFSLDFLENPQIFLDIHWYSELNCLLGPPRLSCSLALWQTIQHVTPKLKILNTNVAQIS